MERALLGRAVAKIAKHHFTTLSDLRRPGRAGRVRYACADDARGAEKAARGVGQMHRSAQPLAEAVNAAVDLSHHRLWIAAEHQWVAVAPVSRQHCVAGLKQRQ